MHLDDESKQQIETATSSLNLEESVSDLSNKFIGVDKTSADYYFDSYSHFGMTFYSFSVSIHWFDSLFLKNLICWVCFFFVGIHEVSIMQ